MTLFCFFVIHFVLIYLLNLKFLSKMNDRNIFANYSPSVRGIIIGLLESGYTATQTSRIIGCNLRTVLLWQRRYLMGGESMLQDHRKRNQRPNKTNLEEDENLISAALNHPFEAAADFLAHAELRISARTAQRRLRESGLVCRLAACKPRLTEDHRHQRIQYALNYLGWTHQWNSVIWSDEKCFSTSMTGKLQVWRPRRDRLNPAYVVPDNYAGRQNIMYWGCMSSLGVMALQEVSARMNAEEYVEILEEVMLPAARQVFPEDEYPEITFMHDNSAVHTARLVQTWFAHHPEVHVLPHPAKSPDLNPIENIWSVMSNEWRVGQQIRTREQLRNNVEQVWMRVSRRPNITQNLVGSMHRRLQAVIVNEGYWIKY